MNATPLLPQVHAEYEAGSRRSDAVRFLPEISHSQQRQQVRETSVDVIGWSSAATSIVVKIFIDVFQIPFASISSPVRAGSRTQSYSAQRRRQWGGLLRAN